MLVAAPLRVQPLKVPVSKPPLVMPPVTGLLTVSVYEAVCVAEVPVPVIVIVYVPAGVLALVVSVSVDEPPLVTELGLKPAAAPLGRPEALSATVCADPEVVVVLTVEVMLPPWVTVPLLGETEIEKLGAGGALSATSSYRV